MAVLERKLGQPGGLVLCSGIIQRLEFVPEQPLRPTVRDQMMKLDQQRMILFAESQKPGARYDMVRIGIGIYGLAPSPALAGARPSCSTIRRPPTRASS